MTVHPIAASVDLQGVVALAFTSANGVDAFAARFIRRDFEVFTVGDATADAARAAGFRSVASANDDGAGLVRLIVQANPAGVVLAPGPRRPALDLVSALSQEGLACRAVALYETLAPASLPEAVCAALNDRTLTAVLLHSARAAEAFAMHAAAFDLTDLCAIGLSPACIQPLAHLDLQAKAAAVPREDALLDALLAALGKPPRAR